VSRRGWFLRTHQLAGVLRETGTQYRCISARGAEILEPPVETICRHLFEQTRWLNIGNPRFGRAGFDFVQGDPTRDVCGVADIHCRYRAHLLVGSGRRLAEEHGDIIKYQLPKLLRLEKGFGINHALLSNVFQDFFGRNKGAPCLVFPMSIYPSSRYVAATHGVRVVDEDVQPNGDQRTDRAIASTEERLHLVRFGRRPCFKDRNFQLDLRTARFAVPEDRKSERFKLSSWSRWRVGIDTENVRYQSVYQEELGYSTSAPEDEILRREAYLPCYADKVYRDARGKSVYLDLCNLVLIRLLPLGNEMEAETDIMTISFDRGTGHILDLCSFNSTFNLYYARNPELRALLKQHVKWYGIN
jgi:hypothetical protein